MPRAFEETLVGHVEALRRYARTYARNSDDADDLVQETLAKILERVSIWRPVNINNVKAYMFKTLRNLYLDDVERGKRYVNGMSVDYLEYLTAAPPIQYLHLEVSDLTAALERISQGHREILLLVGAEGMTYEEAATILDIPIGTVMSRLSRARESLHDALSDKPPRTERPGMERRPSFQDQAASMSSGALERCSAEARLNGEKGGDLTGRIAACAPARPTTAVKCEGQRGEG